MARHPDDIEQYSDEAWLQNTLDAEKEGYIGILKTQDFFNMKRKEMILGLMKEALNEYPEFRVGQLLYIAAARGSHNGNGTDVFYTTDEIIEKGLNIILRKSDENG
jgi:hypothetical protein